MCYDPNFEKQINDSLVLLNNSDGLNQNNNVLKHEAYKRG